MNVYVDVVIALRRCMENENSGLDVVKLTATHSYIKPESDDVEVPSHQRDGLRRREQCV